MLTELLCVKHLDFCCIVLNHVIRGLEEIKPFFERKERQNKEIERGKLKAAQFF